MIAIESLWATQRNLKRKTQIPNLMKLERFKDLIELHLCEDREIQINNGHHRVLAIWLSGRKYLYPDEYKLILTNGRPRLKKVLEII